MGTRLTSGYHGLFGKIKAVMAKAMASSGVDEVVTRLLGETGVVEPLLFEEEVLEAFKEEDTRWAGCSAPVHAPHA